MHEELLGDMEERFHLAGGRSQKRALLKYCIEILRVMPFLFMIRIRTVNLHKSALQFLIIAMLVLMVLAWETTVVHSQTWPITANLMASAPISAIGLFFSIYSLLYLLGAFLAFSLSVLITQTFQSNGQHLIRANPVFLAIALSVTSVFSILSPQQMDSFWMRLFLLAQVWVMAFGARYVVRRICRSTDA